MGLTEVCETDSIPKNGDRILVEIGGNEIAIFNIKGEYHAILNYCVHQGGPICEGELSGMLTDPPDQWNWGYEKEGEVVICPWHGWKFDVLSGKNVQNEDHSIPIFETEVRDGIIYIDY